MIRLKQSILVLLLIVGVTQAQDIKVVYASVLTELKAEAGDISSILRIFNQAVNDRNEKMTIVWGSRMVTRFVQDCTLINFDTEQFFDCFECVYKSLIKDFSVEQQGFIEKSIQNIKTINGALAVWSSALEWAAKLKNLPGEPTWIVEQLAKEGKDITGLIIPNNESKKNDFATLYKFVISFFFTIATK